MDALAKVANAILLLTTLIWEKYHMKMIRVVSIDITKTFLLVRLVANRHYQYDLTCTLFINATGC